MRIRVRWTTLSALFLCCGCSTGSNPEVAKVANELPPTLSEWKAKGFPTDKPEVKLASETSTNAGTDLATVISEYSLARAALLPQDIRLLNNYNRTAQYNLAAKLLREKTQIADCLERCSGVTRLESNAGTFVWEDYSGPLNTEARNLMQDLRAFAIAEAQAGNWSEAIKYANCLEKVTEVAYQQDYSDELLAAQLLDRNRFRTLSGLAALASRPEQFQQLNALCRPLASQKQVIQHAWVNEGFRILHSLRNCTDEEWSHYVHQKESSEEVTEGQSYLVINRPQVGKGLPDSTLRQAILAIYLQQCLKNLKLLDENTSEFQKFRQFSGQNELLPHSDIVPISEEVLYRPTFNAGMLADTEGNLCANYIQILEFFHLNKRWPKASEIQLKVDLYSDKKLVYRPDSQGFTLYSVGPDGEDDGGPLEAPSRDIGMAYPTPMNTKK